MSKLCNSNKGFNVIYLFIVNLVKLFLTWETANYFQYQIEGTDEGYSSSIGEAVEGVIDFFDQRLKTIHTVNITLPHNKAKPYRPTVVEKPLPRGKNKK